MKKYLCAFLCIIFLVGCSKNSLQSPVNRNIAYRAHIFYYGQEYDCDVTINEYGKADYLIKGGSLDGFCASFDEGLVSYSFLDKESEKSDNFKCGMFETLFFMNENSVSSELVKEGQEFIVSGNTDIGEFRLFISGTGLPLYAELDGRDFYVDFYDVNIINGG